MDTGSSSATSGRVRYRRPRQTDSDGAADDRSPAAVHCRVINDLRQRITAVSSLQRSDCSVVLDMTEVQQCDDVHRLAELLKLSLASVCPQVVEMSVDEHSGLVTVGELATDAENTRQVPMYRLDSHGRLVSHYVHITAGAPPP